MYTSLLSVVSAFTFTVGLAHAGVTAWGTTVNGGGVLSSIDLGTGAATAIGPVGGDATGLAYDPNAGILYGIDRASDSLVTINTSTGAASTIGSLGIGTAAGGAAFDRNSNSLYYTDNVTSGLYSVNTSTGAASLIGNHGIGIMQGLAFDPNTNTLYGTTSTTNSLYSLNTLTGASSLIGSFGDSIVDHGLAFDDTTGILYLAEANAGGNLLYTVDLGSGSLTSIGLLGANIQGFEIAQAPVPAPGPLVCLGLVGLASTRRRR